MFEIAMGVFFGHLLFSIVIGVARAMLVRTTGRTTEQ